jgi:hypothetical protein
MLHHIVTISVCYGKIQKSSDLGKIWYYYRHDTDRVKNWALIISCYVLTLFLIHTTSTCIVRLGDICNALRYSNQYFIFGILIGHDLSMRILYRFHGWLIFARVIALFIFVWPYGPSAHLVYATSHLSFVGFYSYLVSWLAMIWACAYYTDITDGWFLQEL